MENERIQRLLLAGDYGELAGEPVLVESPFAETTRAGRGVREVALGLTRTRLLVAADVFRDDLRYWCPPGVDPIIETLELVSIYPLNFVTLSVFRRRRRRTLKARLVDGRVKYYELGGLGLARGRLWAQWGEYVRGLLERRCPGSSISEPTAAASSTCPSTLYCLSSGFEYDSTSGRCRKARRARDWARCRGAGDVSRGPTWTQRNLYLGPEYEELFDGHYRPLPTRFAGATFKEVMDKLEDHSPNIVTWKKNYKNRLAAQDNHRQKQRSDSTGGLCDVIFTRKDRRRIDQRQLAATGKNSNLKRDRQELVYIQTNKKQRAKFQRYPNAKLDIEDPESEEFVCSCCRNYHKVSKISSTTCQSDRLTGGAEPRTGKFIKLSRFGCGVEENCKSGLCLKANRNHSRCDLCELIESGVSLWENSRKSQGRSSKQHLRRYAISMATYFLSALGPWSVQPGDRESVQYRRSRSCVTIRRQPVDTELRLPISRRQLKTSISLTNLSRSPTTESTRALVILFWTTDYWYRPRAATEAYRELRRHIALLDRYREQGGGSGNRCGGHSADLKSCDICSQSSEIDVGCILGRMFSSNVAAYRSSQSPTRQDHHQNQIRGTTAYLRRLLKLEYRVSLWDLDSTTLARQLTIIDRELFVRVPRYELDVLVRQRTSRETPNVGAWVAFAHRISCLTASEVLSARKLDMRARLVARLLNTAERCFEMGNFHSARSIVAGLQSPAVYRLRTTWTYMKTYHAIRYETMEKLCKLFKSTRSRQYREAWGRAELNAPSLPFVGDVLTRVLVILDDQKEDRDFQSGYETIAREASVKAVEKQKLEVQRKRGLKGWIQKIKFSARSRDKNYHDVIVNEEDDEYTGDELQARQRIYDDRRRATDELADWLELHQRQALAYDFPGHELAWEFLLKARYREDKENFLASLQLEPPD